MLKDHGKFWRYNNGLTIICKDITKDGVKFKLHDFSIVNAGINGDLAWNLLERLDDVIDCNPNHITILIGTNVNSLRELYPRNSIAISIIFKLIIVVIKNKIIVFRKLISIPQTVAIIVEPM